MKTTGRTLITAVLLALAPELSGAGEEGGWSPLFNGKDTSGWKLKVPRSDNGWTVRDGVYVPSATTGMYEVVDVAQGKIITKIKTGGNPHNVVCSADGKNMYLSPLGDPNRIFIVETATHQVVEVATHKSLKWIPVGKSPNRILAVTVPQF